MPPSWRGAFVMAEYLAVSYFQVTVWAWIPALLFYRGALLRGALRGQARRAGGRAARGAAAPGRVMRGRHLFIPILIVLAGMAMSYSAPFARWRAPFGPCRSRSCAGRRARASPGAPSWSAGGGARDALAVAMACACAGIVIA